MGKKWNMVKKFWNDNFVKNYKKISTSLGTFLVSVIDLLIPVVLYYTSMIIPIVFGTFLFLIGTTIFCFI